MKEPLDDIIRVIKSFQESLKQHLPALEAEVHLLIESNSSDKNTIENTLDTLLSLKDFGVGEDLYIQLLEYYKKVDAEGAAFYWNEFDKSDDDE